jgi:hypothetical protein
VKYKDITDLKSKLNIELASNGDYPKDEQGRLKIDKELTKEQFISYKRDILDILVKFREDIHSAAMSLQVAMEIGIIEDLNEKDWNSFKLRQLLRRI